MTTTQVANDPSRFSLLRGPGDGGSDLLTDARAGLLSQTKSLPPKYFYDSRGSELFEAICATPEYYPTRAEADLLAKVGEDVIHAARPTHLVELGSGSAEKTPHLLRAMGVADGSSVYVPIEISPSALNRSSARLLEQFPWLTIVGICADYEHGLSLLPAGERRLFAFLGSTLGNFTQDAAIQFLRQVRQQMNAADRLLLGADLVKDRETLQAAYNDAQGVTADFNLNVLEVMNRELGADFDRRDFRHHAFFNETDAQIEMHLVAERNTEVEIPALDTSVSFEAGESIRTEISRKFTQDSLQQLLADAGFQMERFWTPEDDAFSLSMWIPIG